ncbi:MAG TPA: aminotransferase class V-fold PLP-dependent enzyme [Vicinamibacterales bacterium]|jgi:selenocysteine lyase/cysteine desulfurase|nr:aminotransferase class V-fold PLP-dependent enzyme [Vicinamibacterales bacterium]
MTPDEFRSRFPIFSKRIFVNTCSQGALSTDVDEAMRAYLDCWHEHGSPWERWVDEVEQLRMRFAASIGADVDEIAVMPSASAGINAIASALSFSGTRSQVVIGDFEFPTMAQVWLAQERRGASIRRARAPSAAPDTLPLEAYAAAIDERTLVVPATHVCFRNGHKTDIAGLTRLAHDRGAFVFLDDYQRTGAGPIDVHALGVDFMVTGCLKYLLAAAGIGFLYVRRDLIQRFEPTVTGWFGRVNPFAFRIDEIDWPSGANRFESGTPPVPNAYAALAALELLDRIGYDAVGHQVEYLAARYARAACDHGFVVRTPVAPDRCGPLVVVQSVDAPELVRKLAARGIIASCRGNGLRVAFHAYNTEGDADAVVSALIAESALLERRHGLA